MGDFWSGVVDFAEGAWETVAPLAEQAVGVWAAGQTNAPNPNNPNPNGTSTTLAEQGQTTATNTSSNANDTSSNSMVLDTKTMLIGGGVVLAAIVLLR